MTFCAMVVVMVILSTSWFSFKPPVRPASTNLPGPGDVTCLVVNEDRRVLVVNVQHAVGGEADNQMRPAQPQV